MAIDKLNTSTPIKSLLKTNELIDAVNNLNLNYLQRNKDYSIGDICYYNGLSPKYILKCIQEGITAAAEPSSISDLNLGDELEDGAAKFLITKNINHDENYLYVGKEEDIVNSDLLHENMIVVDPDEDIVHDAILKEDFIMMGATTDSNGIEGFVPAPLAGEANRFLASDGTWKVVETDVEVPTKVSQLENDSNFISEIPANLDEISTINGTSFTPTNQNGGIKIADVTLEQGNLTANKLTAGFTQVSAGTIMLDSVNSWNSSGLTVNGNLVITESIIGNAANKIPKYNSEGHLVLPNGAEIW